MSYTTLWPPYHSNLEIANTSRTFYRLSKKEQARYDFIMSHDFSWKLLRWLVHQNCGILEKLYRNHTENYLWQ